MRRVLRALSRLAMAAVIGMAAFVGGSTTHAQATPDNILPGSTLAAIQIADASDLGKALGDSQFGQLLADPALKPIIDDVKAKLEDLGKQAQANLGLTIEQILDLPEGPITAAILPAPGKAFPVSLLIGVDAGDNAPDMLKLMNKLTDIGREQGSKVTTEDFNGVTLTLIDNPKINQTKFAWMTADTYFVLSAASDLDAIKDVLANADGREDSLASNAAYKATMAKADANAHVTWFLSVASAYDLIGKVLEAQGGGSADQIAAQLQLTGLDGLKAAGGSIDINSGPYDTISKTVIYAPGEAQGLLRIFNLPQVDLAPQPWVPASAASYQSVSWDLDAAFKAITELVDTFAPGVMGAFEQQLAGNQGEGLKFERDIFGPLGDRITVVSDFKKPVTETSQRLLVGVALDDAKAFQNTLNKIFDLVGGKPASREFQGTTVYDFDLPEMPQNAGANIPRSASMAIANDTLYLASDPELLEQVLRGGASALAEDADYQAVAKHFPSTATTIGYQRPEDAARLLYNMVKSGQFEAAIRESAENAGNAEVEVPKIIDPEKLPDFEVFAKYMTSSGSYSQADPDGAIFTQFSLKK